MRFLFQVREIVSDFNVVIAVVIMVITDWGVGLRTPKLLVPEKFEVRYIDQHYLDSK